MKRKNRRKKGISAILGGAILFGIIFTTGATYFTTIQADNQLTQVESLNRVKDIRDLRDEDFRIDVELDSNSFMIANVTNEGGSAINFVEMFVIYNGTIVKYLNAPPLPKTINQGLVYTINSTVVYDNGTYYFRGISERGGVVTGQYPPLLLPFAEAAIISISQNVTTRIVGSTVIQHDSFRWIKNENDTQSGNQVGGFPAFSKHKDDRISYLINITNNDPKNRGITLWPSSGMAVIQLKEAGGIKEDNFYIAEGLQVPPKDDEVSPYNSTKPYTYLAINETTTLFFGSKKPLDKKAADGHTDKGPMIPTLTLIGIYDDGSLYGQTIPFLASFVGDGKIKDFDGSSVNNYHSGDACEVIEIKGEKFIGNRQGIVGWMTPAGTMFTLVDFNFAGDGKITTNLTVPDVAPGWYIIILTDHIEAGFMQFELLGSVC